MIATLAADQAGAGALAVELVIGERDFQRRYPAASEPELQKKT